MQANTLIRFSAQPLTILGVTGPFSVLAENIYELCQTNFKVSTSRSEEISSPNDIPKVDFLSIMAWSLIHVGWMHYLLAIFNAHDWTMQYVTNFTADIFSLLNSVIYFHKAALVLQRTHTNSSLATFLYSVIGALGTCFLAVFLSTARSWKPLFHRYVRIGLAEYAAAISIIIWIAIPHAGELSALDHETLEINNSFIPTDPARASFFVKFWQVPVSWVFLSIIPGAIITILFYFDHEISSIICTTERYGVRKPGGFAWDIFLLGSTTILCGVLGIPPANGLLPQAPLHSESLVHHDKEDHGERQDIFMDRKATGIYEQRYSPLMQAILIMVFASPPFQRVLGFTQTSVLAGIFLLMGYQSLSVNPVLHRVGYMLTPKLELPTIPPNSTWSGIHAYTILQVFLTGVVFGMTLTVAAPAFPLVIVALVPIRLVFINRLWSKQTLRLVDGWACRPGKPEDDVHN